MLSGEGGGSVARTTPLWPTAGGAVENKLLTGMGSGWQQYCRGKAMLLGSLEELLLVLPASRPNALSL